MTTEKLIETLMRDLDLTQEGLAQVMGVTQSAVSRMARGKLPLTWGAICRLYEYTYFKPDSVFEPLHLFLIAEGRRQRRGQV